MPKIVTRIVAVLLIPCLTGAQSSEFSAQNAGFCLLNSAIFTSQAVAASLLSSSRFRNRLAENEHVLHSFGSEARTQGVPIAGQRPTEQLSMTSWFDAVEWMGPLNTFLFVAGFLIDLVSQRDTGQTIIPWIVTFAPLAPLFIMMPLGLNIFLLKRLGRHYRAGLIPPAPDRLFGFTSIDVAENVAFMTAEGRALLLHPDAAALFVKGFAPWWLRCYARMALSLLAAPGHEALHTFGLQERWTYFLAQNLPPLAGFALGSYGAVALSPSFLGVTFGMPLAGIIGLISAFVITLAVNEFIARLSRIMAVRLFLFHRNLIAFKKVRGRLYLKDFDKLANAYVNDPELSEYLHTHLGEVPAAVRQLMDRVQEGRPIFEGLDEERVSRGRGAENYRLKVAVDTRDRKWEVEFWWVPPPRRHEIARGAGPWRKPKKIGRMRFYYNRTGGALSIREVSVDRAFLSDLPFLCTNVLGQMAGKLPPFTKVRQPLLDERDLISLYDALSDDPRWKVRDDNSVNPYPTADALVHRWRDELREVSREETASQMDGRILRRLLDHLLSAILVKEEKTAADNLSAMRSHLRMTETGHLFESVGLMGVNVLPGINGGIWVSARLPSSVGVPGAVRPQSPYPEAPVWLQDWWDDRPWENPEEPSGQERVPAGIERDAMENPLEKEARGIEVQFVLDFVRALHVSPPLSLMKDLSAGLRRFTPQGQKVVDGRWLRAYIELLTEEVEAKSHIVPIEIVKQMVANHYSVRINRMHLKGMLAAGTVTARDVAIYLADKLCGLSKEQIAPAFGARTMDDVIHAIGDVERDLDDIPSFKFALERLGKRIWAHTQLLYPEGVEEVPLEELALALFNEFREQTPISQIRSGYWDPGLDDSSLMAPTLLQRYWESELRKKDHIDEETIREWLGSPSHPAVLEHIEKVLSSNPSPFQNDPQFILRVAGLLMRKEDSRLHEVLYYLLQNRALLDTRSGFELPRAAREGEAENPLKNPRVVTMNEMFRRLQHPQPGRPKPPFQLRQQVELTFEEISFVELFCRLLDSRLPQETSSTGAEGLPRRSA